MLHIISPYATDKNLGYAYNEAMSLLDDDDWCCLRDNDTLFLTPDCGEILQGYARLFPGAGLLTCFTNRIHHTRREQLLTGTPSEDFNIRNHIKLAVQQKEELYTVTEIKQASGFLILISKKTWMKYKFSDGLLGADDTFVTSLRKAGRNILRMNGLYVFHTYRAHDITDTSHLK